MVSLLCHLMRDLLLGCPVCGIGAAEGGLSLGDGAAEARLPAWLSPGLIPSRAELAGCLGVGVQCSLL